MRLRGAVVMAAASLPAMAASQAPARLQLVRCTPTSDAPCLRTRIQLSASERSGAAQFDSASEQAAWAETLGTSALAGPGLASLRASTIRTRLLILIDRGAAMSGEGIAFARIALKAWLPSLDSAAVTVAIAGFDGRDLAHQLDALHFGPVRSALADLDGLRPPEAKARSPLFSAVLLASQHLGPTPTAINVENALLIITAGHNDVGKGREAGDLLTGATGLSQASAAVASSGQRVWVVALGQTEVPADIAELEGPRGSAWAVPLDPNAIAARLSAVGRELLGSREIIFGVGGAGLAGLARSAAKGTAELRHASDIVASISVAWRPPLIATPAFQATVDSAALSPAWREALLAGTNGGGNRPVIALLVGLVVVSLWLLVPRLAWNEGSGYGPTARDSVTATGAARDGPRPEAAVARKPEDITKQTARRTAMHR